MVSFFPLAIVGWSKEKATLPSALRFYYASILIFCLFLMCLAVYTYTKGGSFIPPMGTFY
jgi:hypothetical protein